MLENLEQSPKANKRSSHPDGSKERDKNILQDLTNLNKSDYSNREDRNFEKNLK